MKAQHAAVYAIKNLVTKTVYVGSTSNLSKRKSRHKIDLVFKRHRNPRLQAAWDKFGADSFSFEVLEWPDDPRQLLAREQAWLRRLKRDGVPVYNIYAVNAPKEQSRVRVWEENECDAETDWRQIKALDDLWTDSVVVSMVWHDGSTR